jgi:hypothetical protein
MLKKLLIFLIIVLYGLSLFIFISVYRADVFYKKARDSVAERSPVKGLEFINKAIEINSMEPAYYRERARIYLIVSANRDQEAVRVLKNLALEDLQTAYFINPDNIVNTRNSIPLYYFLSAGDLTESANKENVDYRFIPHTKEFYRYAKTISPNDVGIYVALAKYENRLGLSNELAESTEKIRLLRPDLFDWHESLEDIDVSF